MQTSWRNRRLAVVGKVAPLLQRWVLAPGNLRGRALNVIERVDRWFLFYEYAAWDRLNEWRWRCKKGA